MRYKTFRALLFMGGALAAAGAIAGAYVACSGGDKQAGTASAKTDTRTAKTSTPTPSPTATQQSAQPVTSAPGDPNALRPMDQKILDKVHAGIGADKIKDAFKGESYKVNLYREGGKARAKVDSDRDDKFDEKWDFETEDGKEVVKRRVATKDDENYDVEFRLREGKWAPKQP